MGDQREPANLEQLLDRIECGTEVREYSSIGEMLDAIGRRSFGPMVLFVGLLLVTPLSGMPGMPTSMGLLILLTLGQVLIGRRHFWLPGWLARRKIPREKLLRGIKAIRPVARRVDRLLRPRLHYLARGPGLYVMAVACMVIAFSMPATELVPFSSSLAGLALMGFGLAMISKDGLVALVAWVIVLGVAATVVGNFA